MTVGPLRAEEAERPDPYAAGAYRWYALLILTLVFACHAIDRGIPNLLLEPIRREYHLNDKQLGLFSGLGFAITFSAAILPMGYISDRTNRRNFLAFIVVIWSLFTALGGLARSYVQLVAARMGVGAFESGAAPVAIPMLSDIFPPERRSTALGIFYLSNALGALLASVVGGYVAAQYGWRAAFLIAGVPGIVLAVLLLLTVKEPWREASTTDATVAKPKLREVFAFLAGAPGLIVLTLSCALMGMVAITLGAWISSFYIRVHHLNLKQVGLTLGLAGLFSGVCSPLLMGWLGDRLSRYNVRGPLLMVAIAALISAGAGVTMLFSPSLALAIGAMMLADLCRTGYSPPCYAVVMNRTPPALRGTTMSVIQLTTNLFGFGVGPLMVGVLSDFYGGGAALRYAMATALGFMVVASALMFVAAHMLYPSGSGGGGRVVPGPTTLSPVPSTGA